MALSYLTTSALCLLCFAISSTAATELHVKLFKHKGFNGFGQTHILPSHKECVPLDVTGRKASSVQVLRGNCIQICKETCGNNRRRHSSSCMLIYGDLHSFGETFNDQVSSIRRCSEEETARGRSEIMGMGNPDIGYEVGLPPLPSMGIEMEMNEIEGRSKKREIHGNNNNKNLNLDPYGYYASSNSKKGIILPTLKWYKRSFTDFAQNHGHILRRSDGDKL